jgi:hypothetical protein
MTVRKQEQRAAQRQQSDPARDRETELYQFRVLTFGEWCALNRISPATGRRLLNQARAHSSFGFPIAASAFQWAQTLHGRPRALKPIFKGRKLRELSRDTARRSCSGNSVTTNTKCGIGSEHERSKPAGPVVGVYDGLAQSGRRSVVGPIMDNSDR